MTEPLPDGGGVRMCIERALASAGVTPDRVSYVNAHATSTPAGDMAEYRAIRWAWLGWGGMGGEAAWWGGCLGG
jgi:3-oxoacyl-(acyl-carrier-protein) synthase